MLKPELPNLPELPCLDDDPTLFDRPSDWFVPRLELSREEDEADEDGLGLRSLIERPEVLASAWRTTRRDRHRKRARGTKRRHSGRTPRQFETA